jgi:hypothetical protein
MKRTSDRVSTIAGRVLGKLDGDTSLWVTMFHGLKIRDVRALAASCLAQDEAKGKRAKKKRKAKA